MKSEDVAHMTVGGLGGVLRAVALTSKLLYKEKSLSGFTRTVDAFQSNQISSFRRLSTLL